MSRADWRDEQTLLAIAEGYNTTALIQQEYRLGPSNAQLRCSALRDRGLVTLVRTPLAEHRAGAPRFTWQLTDAGRAEVDRLTARARGVAA